MPLVKPLGLRRGDPGKIIVIGEDPVEPKRKKHGHSQDPVESNSKDGWFSVARLLTILTVAFISHLLSSLLKKRT